MTLTRARIPTSNFTLDRDAFATHLELEKDEDEARYGLHVFATNPGFQISGATKRALACGAITPADGAQLHVFPGEGTSVVITVRDLPPTPQQLRERASAGLPCYRHIGDIRDWPDLKPAMPEDTDTFTGTCEAIEKVLAAANELLAALATLRLGEANVIAVNSQPLRVLNYSPRGRISSYTTDVSGLTDDDSVKTEDLWALLIEALEAGQADESRDEARHRTLQLRTGGAEALARQLSAARARLLHLGAVGTGRLPDPKGGFSRHIA